jgi:hypothetical protein
MKVLKLLVLASGASSVEYSNSLSPTCAETAQVSCDEPTKYLLYLNAQIPRYLDTNQLSNTSTRARRRMMGAGRRRGRGYQVPKIRTHAHTHTNTHTQTYTGEKMVPQTATYSTRPVHQ